MKKALLIGAILIFWIWLLVPSAEKREQSRQRIARQQQTAARPAQASPERVAFSPRSVLNGNGHDWQKLTVDQQLQVTELISETINKHSQYIFWDYLDSFYRENEQNLNKDIAEIVAVGAVMNLKESDNLTERLNAALKKERNEQ